MDPENVVSLIGALGFGSVLGQYLSSGGQRRSTRAQVLTAIAECETRRWVGPEKREPFPEAVRELEAAALVARVPREAVLHYKVLAWAAFWMSTEAWDQNPDPETGGGVEWRYSQMVGNAAADLVAVAWSPWLSRLRVRRHRRLRRTAIENLLNEWDSKPYHKADAEIVRRAQTQKGARNNPELP